MVLTSTIPGRVHHGVVETHRLRWSCRYRERSGVLGVVEFAGELRHREVQTDFTTEQGIDADNVEGIKSYLG
jgi:hypothetical protein